MSFCDHLHSFPCSWMIVVDKMVIYNFRMKVCVNVFLIPYDKIETLRMKMNSSNFARKCFLTEKCWDKFQKIQQDSCQSSRSFIIILICSLAIEIMAFRDIWTYYFLFIGQFYVLAHTAILHSRFWPMQNTFPVCARTHTEHKKSISYCNNSK